MLRSFIVDSAPEQLEEDSEAALIVIARVRPRKEALQQPLLPLPPRAALGAARRRRRRSGCCRRRRGRRGGSGAAPVTAPAWGPKACLRAAFTLRQHSFGEAEGQGAAAHLLGLGAAPSRPLCRCRQMRWRRRSCCDSSAGCARRLCGLHLLLLLLLPLPRASLDSCPAHRFAGPGRELLLAGIGCRAERGSWRLRSGSAADHCPLTARHVLVRWVAPKLKGRGVKLAAGSNSSPSRAAAAAAAAPPGGPEHICRRLGARQAVLRPRCCRRRCRW